MRVCYCICCIGQYLSGLQPSEVVVTKAHNSEEVKTIPLRFDW